jgi:hypothetical protein
VSIGFKAFHLRWVLHLLIEDLRQKWKEHASAILPFLYAAQRDGWPYLVTDPESWFSSIYHYVGCGLCREIM